MGQYEDEGARLLAGAESCKREGGTEKLPATRRGGFSLNPALAKVSQYRYLMYRDMALPSQEVSSVVLDALGLLLLI